MSDFTINIDSNLNLSKAESQMNSFLSKYKNEPIKIKVDVDTKGINTSNFAKQIQASLSQTANGIHFSGNTFYKEYFEQAKKDVKESKRIEKEFKNSLSSIDTSGIDKNAIKAINARKSAEIKAQREFNKTLEDKYKQQQKIDTASSRLSTLKSRDISKYKDSSGYEQIVANLKKATELQSSLNAEKAKGNNANFDKMNSDLKEMNSLLSKSETLYNNLTKPISTIEAMTASNKTVSWLKNNSKAAKDYGDILNSLAEKQKNATTAGELKQYTKEVNAIKSQASAEGKTGASVFAELKRAGSQILQFTSIYGGWQLVGNAIRDSISELKEMDSILTEISKVSDMTTTELNQLGKDSFDYASKYGKKVTDYLQGVTEMNRSGFYGKQGVELANTSVLAQAAGDMNADVANSYLLATNAAYEYAGSAEKLNAVLDGQNMITNRNSVNMTDMADATSKAASMAAQTGVQVDELSAIIGTAVSRTKQDGNIVGTAIKSLFINLQDTSNKKIVGTFDELGISQTKFVNGSERLKTPIELLKELANAYNALPEGSTLKADVLRNIGNRRQANVLAAILGGIGNGDYDSMLKDYSEGMGSAAKEAEKSANNWEGSLNKLSNSWTEFVGNFADSGQITGGINSVNSLVQALNSLVEVATPLGTIGAGAGIFAFFKNLDKPTNHRVSA